PPPTADVRPALMSVTSLMMLLLPMLLMATSAQKLTGLALSVPGPTEQLPPELPGVVEQLSVYRVSSGYRVEASVRTTDIGSAAGDTEQKSFTEPTLTALQTRLRTFKVLDPGRDRVRLIPTPDTPTEEVVRWMDAVRIDREGPLFPRVVMDASGEAPR
ncbi:MAG: hypothetical protein ACI8S6_001014, partial [Myxococcota bacterium]